MSGMFGGGIRQSPTKSVEWYTPAWIFEALAIDFDLDPASPFDWETLVPAKQKYTKIDDGLNRPWFGRVWLNPPYGKSTPRWIHRMVKHGNGIALLFSRTDAKWCQDAMKAATGILFLSGRVNFIPGNENRHKKSRCGAGTVMFAFGSECASALKNMSNFGVYVRKI